MAPISQEDITGFIEKNIHKFHDTRLEKLQTLKLGNVLGRKNPYLFKAKHITKASDLVEALLSAHLSSQEEGIFGGFLESLAVFISGKIHDGHKSSAEGIDLEFDNDRAHYIVSIKSGPNWGNSGQIAKMKDNFRKAKRILGTNVSRQNVVAINACCYGNDSKPDKGDYLKLCGQRFWEFISGEENLYTDIIEPLGHKAKEKNDKFSQEYGRVINRFTADFIQRYCDQDGDILWEKIVKENSGKLKSRQGTGA